MATNMFLFTCFYMLCLNMSSQAIFIVEGNTTKMTKIGDLHGFFYEVAGHVFAKNEDTLLIANFNYSGKGPDAYFWVGTEGTPRTTDEASTAILAYPFGGKHYEYKDSTAPRLGKLDNEDISLTLPPHLRVRDLKWLSVWCRSFSANFGHILFPDKIHRESVEDSNEETTTSKLENSEDLYTDYVNATTVATADIQTPEQNPTTTVPTARSGFEEVKPRKGKNLEDEETEEIISLETDLEGLNQVDEKIEVTEVPIHVKEDEESDSLGHVILPNLILFIIVVFAI